MRALVLLAGAALSLSACGGEAETDANAVDTLAVNNLVVEDNGMADATMNADLNATMNAVDANATNAVMEDLTTNEADANLANGL